MKFRTFLVGGAVRDMVMEQPIHDKDFVVLAPSFDAMKQDLLADGADIFVEKPEYLVIRCKHPVHGAADFAVARQDGSYSDGRRPNSTAIADTIESDLARRDFTCNAMAIDTGKPWVIIDPFRGQSDIEAGALRCVGNTADRFGEDKLRVFRALRFAVTKGFFMAHAIYQVTEKMSVADFDGVSTERIREELLKMFKHDTMRSLDVLDSFPVLKDVIRARKIWFQPTTKQ